MLDASIYQNQNIQPVQAPSVVDAAKNASSLSQIMLQNQTQQAMRSAYQGNMGQDGKLNQQGFLSDLGKVNPQAAMEMGQNFAKQTKDQADAQIAQQEALQKRASIFASGINYVTGVPEASRPEAYKAVIGQMKSNGVITPDQGIPDDYDPTAFRGFAVGAARHLGQNSKDYLGNQLTQAQIGKTKSEQNQVQVGRLTDYQKTLQNDDEYKKQKGILTEGNTTLGVINDALQNPGSRSQLPVAIARFSTGGQRLNEAEMESFFKNRPANDKLRQIYEDSKNGVLSPANADYAKQYVTTMMNSAAQNKSGIEMDHAKNYSMASGLPVDAAHLALTSSMPGSVAQVPSGPDRFAKGPGAPQPGGGAGVAYAGAKGTSPAEDQAAIKWAQVNLKNPKAQQILKLHRML